MRAWLHTPLRRFSSTRRMLLRTLDGTPQLTPQASAEAEAETGQSRRQRGQSLVELAFITPILALLVAGIMEVGWYANNVLILMEVTRVGARSGTILAGEFSPLAWNQQATLTEPALQADCAARNVNEADCISEDPGLRDTIARFRDCDNLEPGFYNFIACNMIRSMEPLNIKRGDKVLVDRAGNEIRRIPYPDDIVISVFALQHINNENPDDVQTEIEANYNAYYAAPDTEDGIFAFQRAQRLEQAYRQTYWLDENLGRHVTDLGYTTITIGDRYPDGHQVVVVGRYPTNANECNIISDPGDVESFLVELPSYEDYTTTPTDDPTDAPSYDVTVDKWDPFDYITNVPNPPAQDTPLAGSRTTQAFIELDGYDIVTSPQDGEYQRGFSWTGQNCARRAPNSRETCLCTGSEWDVIRLEQVMNINEFIRGRVEFGTTELNNLNEQRSYLPSQGLVLVEMFWMHDLLLNFPLLAPVINAFSTVAGEGDPENIQISTWAAFPVPLVEPNIVYDLPLEEWGEP